MANRSKNSSPDNLTAPTLDEKNTCFDLIVDACCRAVIADVVSHTASRLEDELGYTAPAEIQSEAVCQVLVALKRTMYDMLANPEFCTIIGQFINLASGTIKYSQAVIIPRISRLPFSFTPEGEALLRDYEQQTFDSETCH